jgi:hypothetical protein
MSILRRIEKSLDEKLRAAFGGEGQGGREAIELYRDALDQIAARAVTGRRGDRVFPFDCIRIELRAANDEARTLLDAVFDPAQMLDDVRASFVEARVTPPQNLSIAIEYPPEAITDLRVVCEKAGAAPAPQPAPLRPMRLIPDLAESHFLLDKPVIYIGRTPEVVDTLGRSLRRNDLWFPEEVGEAHASISRAHAHLRFDSATGDWRIFDDGSSLGTSIFRDGHRIEVPPHAPRGIALRPGDEIYLGQARLLFVE